MTEEKTNKLRFKEKPVGMLTVLTITAAISAASLAGFFTNVEDRIEENRLKAEAEAISFVVPNLGSYDVIEDKAINHKGSEVKVKIFKCKDADGKLIGWAYAAKSPGYAADIQIVVGLDLTLKNLTGMKVVQHIETPGLGDVIESPKKFTDQFIGIDVEPQIGYVKNKNPDKPNEIRAITGATISSAAIVKAINVYYKYVKDTLVSKGEV